VATKESPGFTPPSRTTQEAATPSSITELSDRLRTFESQSPPSNKQPEKEVSPIKREEGTPSQQDDRGSERQPELPQRSQSELHQSRKSALAAPLVPSPRQASTEAAQLRPSSVEAPLPALAPDVPVTSAALVVQKSLEKEASQPSPVKSGFAIEGDWIYAPETPEPTKPGLFPPAFIELKIYRSSGEWRGVYHARYQVENRPLDPNVNFLLSGTDVEAQKFNWESPNGSKGTLNIRPVNDSTIKVEWETKIYSTQPVLTSGIATLNKR
jgi:hypothetical protein